uniref:Uncharacterized protein n=1 Tax=Anopheles darlingi TaxID=43151 RepID=A0A2M4D2X7_ANODA
MAMCFGRECTPVMVGTLFGGTLTVGMLTIGEVPLVEASDSDTPVVACFSVVVGISLGRLAISPAGVSICLVVPSLPTVLTRRSFIGAPAVGAPVPMPIVGGFSVDAPAAAARLTVGLVKI